jgi:phenylalanyl-tRNA synthetase beta chain
MLVSWNWLKQYVHLDMPHAELERRLMMAGLNHESTEEVGGDLAIDLEVTSNRPDCLGHIGIAREVAVLFGRELKLPAAQPREGKTPVEKLVKVRIDCLDLCYRYTARVIRGVKVGPSPSWMVRRLQTVGLTPINNVVDISNYVLMECGQPLHTFDMARLKGPEIVVRRPRKGEKIEAIDHKTYELEPDMCVIADAADPVAIGGVMGGATTEIGPATKDVLVESAEFNPMSIRATARRLNLHSDSSYRFERRIDPEGVEWASRRCCELILDLAGGDLAAGVLDVGNQPPAREPVVLRLSQLRRILGIDVPAERVREILVALGNEERVQGSGFRVQECGVRSTEYGVRRQREAPGRCGISPAPSPQSPAPNSQSEIINHKSEIPPTSESSLCFIPPSWRRDLTREIDLIEEVARIHGYEQIPEDVGVPMVPSARSREDRVLAKIRHVLTAAGFDEAVTISLVDEATSAALSPWTDAEPLRTLMPVLRGADRLRRSLVPSLLGVRRTNEALANPEIELFEIAKVYLSRGKKLPAEELMLAVSSGRDYATVRGAIEAIVATLRPAATLETDAARIGLLDSGQACRFLVDGQMIGFAGRITTDGMKQFDLRGPTTVAELKLAPLVQAANLVPRHAPLPPYPAVTRDLNLVVDEAVRWADVAATVRENCGQYCEGVEYRDTYRDPQRLGTEKKSLLLTIALRSGEGTMTSQQADAIRDQIVTACGKKHGAELRA